MAQFHLPRPRIALRPWQIPNQKSADNWLTIGSGSGLVEVA
jgi:hypothetical protein